MNRIDQIISKLEQSSSSIAKECLMYISSQRIFLGRPHIFNRGRDFLINITRSRLSLQKKLNQKGVYGMEDLIRGLENINTSDIFLTHIMAYDAGYTLYTSDNLEILIAIVKSENLSLRRLEVNANKPLSADGEFYDKGIKEKS